MALRGAGHSVFFDRASLPPGGEFHARIRAAVLRCDAFVFLVSPHSVMKGGCARTELVDSSQGAVPGMQPSVPAWSAKRSTRSEAF